MTTKTAPKPPLFVSAVLISTTHATDGDARPVQATPPPAPGTDAGPADGEEEWLRLAAATDDGLGKLESAALVRALKRGSARGPNHREKDLPRVKKFDLTRSHCPAPDSTSPAAHPTAKGEDDELGASPHRQKPRNR